MPDDLKPADAPVADAPKSVDTPPGTNWHKTKSGEIVYDQPAADKPKNDATPAPYAAPAQPINPMDAQLPSGMGDMNDPRNPANPSHPNFYNRPGTTRSPNYTINANDAIAAARQHLYDPVDRSVQVRVVAPRVTIRPIEDWLVVRTEADEPKPAADDAGKSDKSEGVKEQVIEPTHVSPTMAGSQPVPTPTASSSPPEAATFVKCDGGVRATVVAVGPGKSTGSQTGDKVALAVKVGDIVLLGKDENGKDAGTAVDVDGEKLTLVKADAIMAIIDIPVTK